MVTISLLELILSNELEIIVPTSGDSGLNARPTHHHWGMFCNVFAQ